jgi:hypothetical protein
MCASPGSRHLVHEALENVAHTGGVGLDATAQEGGGSAQTQQRVKTAAADDDEQQQQDASTWKACSMSEDDAVLKASVNGENWQN